MKSAQDMKIIEIDITNACIKECSNCTRFCGHHQKTYYMDKELVKKAIDSLEGFKGTFSFIGGEPTLHPDFEELALYLGDKFPHLKETDKQLLHPQSRFIETMSELESNNTTWVDSTLGKKRAVVAGGLLSVVGDKYAEHYEVIQDVFKHQLLNDHTSVNSHQPLLITRKELNVPDDKWIEIRDKCWLQNEWSASINPKGVFFCEVAGTLDILFNGNTGLEITKDWWKKQPDEFGDQLKWCEMCGASLNDYIDYMRNANEQIDDVSPVMLEKLKEIGSRKVARDKINLVEINNKGSISKKSKASSTRFTSNMPYVENYQMKFNAEYSGLFPKGYDAVFYIQNALDMKDIKNTTLSQFDNVYFIFNNLSEEDLFNKEFNKNKDNKDNKEAKTFETFNIDTQEHSEIITTIIENGKKNHYFAMFRNNLLPKDNFVEKMSEYIWNPGALVWGDDLNNNIASEYFDLSKTSNVSEAVAIFSKNSFSIKNLKGDYSNFSEFSSLKELWIQHKIILFDDDLFYLPYQIDVKEDEKYVLYGTGRALKEYYEQIKAVGSEIVAIVDEDELKQTDTFEGIKITSPEGLKELEYDYIIIANLIYRDHIVKSIEGLGISGSKVLRV